MPARPCPGNYPIDSEAYSGATAGFVFEAAGVGAQRAAPLQVGFGTRRFVGGYENVHPEIAAVVYLNDRRTKAAEKCELA